MKPIHMISNRLLAGLLLCILPSCAGHMDRDTLVAGGATSSYRTGAPVTANVNGGSPASSVLANVSNEDFKYALETSLVKSGMFRSVGRGGYQIEALITSIDQPMVGISMTVDMEVSYAVKKAGAVIWRKNITSSYTAPATAAFVGAERMRKATEGAARENINSLIRELEKRRP